MDYKPKYSNKKKHELMRRLLDERSYTHSERKAKAKTFYM